ncbi:MAG TPA: VWA domain-containing protein [Terriglobia bacterium]|nr:VWA domain-containing protein [Terriglobia bacterium]
MLRLNKKEAGARALCLIVLGAMLALPVWLAAQQAPAPAAPGMPPLEKKGGEYKINVEVSLVVLHATVLDKRDRVVNNLKEGDFKVYEDGVPQKLAVFSHADVPVTMGIVIDDSGSMREKRASVNAAALAFVKTSNPQDQVFVVNFNDVYYLDTPGDFASGIEDLRSALEKIDSRGGTALYDAVYASLDHLKLGNRDKKVILVVTDGEDNASRYTFTELIAHAQKSNAVIYTIGLLGEEHSSLFHGGGSPAKKVLKQLAEVTGGQAFLPHTLDEVESTCVGIARDIRNQYTLAYYPSNTQKDGSYRKVRVEASSSAKHDRLTVRTRAGYFAPKDQAAAVASGQ